MAYNLIGRGDRAPSPSAARPAARPVAQPFVVPGGGSGGSGGSGSGSGGYTEIKDPWEKAMKDNYAAASAPSPYQGEWRQGVAQAMSLGNRDYEKDLRGFAAEDTEKQITGQDNQLGAIGMRELALREDVQADRAKLRTDAGTRAVIDSQGIKANALASMNSMLSAASGNELARISQMISSASAGAGHYLDFQNLAVPLQEKRAGAVDERNAQLAQESRERQSRIRQWPSQRRR